MMFLKVFLFKARFMIILDRKRIINIFHPALIHTTGIGLKIASSLVSVSETEKVCYSVHKAEDCC